MLPNLLTGLSSLSLDVPQTTEEILYGSSKMQFQITSSGLDAFSLTSGYGTISISKYTISPNSNNDMWKLKTPSLIINLFSSSTRRLAETSRKITLSPTPLFYIVLPFSSVQNFNFSLDTTSSSFVSSNPSFVLPECTVYNGAEYVSCSKCNISSFTNYNITYGCYDSSLIYGSSSRRLLESDMSLHDDNFNIGWNGIDSQISHQSNQLVRYDKDRYLSSSSSATQFSSIIRTYIPPTSSPTGVPTAEILLPQVISVTSISTRTTIRATATLTGKHVLTTGFLYCIASTNASFSSMAILTQYGVNTAFKNLSSTLSVTLTNLIPFQDYYVFCGITTSNGFKSSSLKILSSRDYVKTACCRTISFTSVAPFVFGDLAVYTNAKQSVPQFSYSISYLPDDPLTIIPILSNLSYTIFSPQSISVIPSSITFTKLSTSIVGTFILSGNEYTEGTYSISLQVISSSGSISGYEVSSTASTGIISSSTPLPAPNMTLAIFSDSGAFVTILFSTATDQAGITTDTFLCSKLFSIGGLCSFLNTSAVKVTFPTTSSQLSPGSVVTLLSGLLRSACNAGSDCSLNIAASSLSVSVRPPYTPLFPTVIVNVPTQSGSCNNLTIDATTSSGSGGRSWKSVSWTVTSSNPSSQTASAIARRLNLRGKNVNQLVVVPSSLFGSESYTFRLSLTNFLGFTSSGSGTVSITGNPNLPTLTITGGSTSSFYSYQIPSMSALATVSSCALTNQIAYSTAIFLNGIRLNFSSNAADPRVFRVAAYTLPPGYSYRVQFNATASATDGYPAVTATTFGSITITRGAVTALIKGGSSRQSPIDKALELDASGSLDDDSLTPSFSYRWSCAISSVKSYGEDCSSIFSTDITLSKVSIPPYTLNVTLAYTFQVLVTSIDGRFSTATANVLPSGVGGVTLSITSSVSLINVDSKLSLSGTIFANYTGSVQVYASWSIYYAGNELTGVNTLTSTSSYFSAAEVLAKTSFPIAFDANTFAQGRTYNFRLSAFPTFDKSLSSFTETSVTINTPPSGGVITISPSKGDALATNFLISCSLWTSSNLPLSYSFSYKVSASSLELVVGSLSLISYAYTTLPSGLAQNNYFITIKNYASDTYGAASSISVSDKVSVLSQKLSSSFSSGNVDGAVQAVNNIASTVNLVNCSSASKSFCGSLNRDVCSAVPNTCSSCITGFTGIVGYSNTRCFNATKPYVPPGSGPPPGTIGASCNGNKIHGIVLRLSLEVRKLRIPS